MVQGWDGSQWTDVPDDGFDGSAFSDVPVKGFDGQQFVRLDSSIPDSVEYRFVASSTSDGSDWTSETGNLTLSVSGTTNIVSNGLNGEDYISYTSNGQHGEDPITNISQPYAITAVWQYPTLGQPGSRGVGTDGTNAFIDPDGGAGEISATGSLRLDSGVADSTNWQIVTGYFNGIGSEIRVDGTIENVGDVGNNDLTALGVAFNGTELNVAEFWIMDSPSSSDLDTTEATLNDKYSIY